MRLLAATVSAAYKQPVQGSAITYCLLRRLDVWHGGLLQATVLLKYGRPVAKCDPWIHRATQGLTIDGPFGNQWILKVLQKMLRNEKGRRFRRCTDVKCPLCLSKMRTPFSILIGCMVSADYWLADYPELRRTTQPSTIDRWSVRRARILHFLQHWSNCGCNDSLVSLIVKCVWLLTQWKKIPGVLLFVAIDTV